MNMDKKQVRRNLWLAGILIVSSTLITLFGLNMIRFFMMLPR
jgi:hypothetical protein